mmetsp:Transcript_22821/g.68511  ORF Transcript_22821/g.68511 Transcript_22821/m.68511 type:complete len:444 (-) Transcript_22821:25-1356(-)
MLCRGALRRVLTRRAAAPRHARAVSSTDWQPVGADQRRGGSLPAWEADDGFLAMRAGATAPEDLVYGETLDPAMDLATTQPGDAVDSPYELTVGEGLRDFWCSAFLSTNRLVTSRPFAQRLGFDDQLLPFDLMLFLCQGMAHATRATDEVAFENARYYAPAYAGDTFRKRFVLRSKRAPKNGRRVLVAFECEMRNQRDELVFSVDKRMMFPLSPNSPEIRFDQSSENAEYDVEGHAMRKKIIEHADQLGTRGGVTLRPLDPGRLILHQAARQLSPTQTTQLAALGRVVHPRHYNPAKFADEPPEARLIVPGPLALAAVNACSGRELHEILFQTLHDVSFTTKLHPGELVAAATYVRSRSESLSGELEKVEVATLGLKNLPGGDATVLKSHPLPRSLLLRDRPLRTHELEDALAGHPVLKPENVVLHAFRSIYRQAPKTEPFLL